jgi:hypothetical protein
LPLRPEQPFFAVAAVSLFFRQLVFRPLHPSFRF